MIEELLSVFRRVAVWLVAIAVGAIGLLVVLRLTLPALANTATAFIATPGGLLLIVVAWWRITRRKGSR